MATQRVRRRRIVAVGPPDTVLGLGLLGIEGTVVADPREAAEALDRALATPDVGMVLVGQTWASELRDRIEAAAVGADTPLVVEVPEPDGITGEASLSERVEQVLGVRLGGVVR